MDSKLVIIRGLPGSGKSTLAKEIAQKCGYLHFENDMYFETEDGYKYNAEEQNAAQKWCFDGASNSLLAGKGVVVSNVFTKIQHMEQFLLLDETAVVIECKKSFGSVHDIPEEFLKRMRDSWESYSNALVM